MSKELREAAERVLEWAALNKHGRLMDQIMAIDALNIISQWYSEHREDDEEPVTAEWLLSVGFVTGCTDWPQWPDFQSFGGEFLEWRSAGFWIGETPIGRTRTRGDVRRLCKVLGIQLKGEA